MCVTATIPPEFRPKISLRNPHEVRCKLDTSLPGRKARAKKPAQAVPLGRAHVPGAWRACRCPGCSEPHDRASRRSFRRHEALRRCPPPHRNIRHLECVVASALCALLLKNFMTLRMSSCWSRYANCVPSYYVDARQNSPPATTSFAPNAPLQTATGLSENTFRRNLLLMRCGQGLANATLLVFLEQKTRRALIRVEHFVDFVVSRVSF